MAFTILQELQFISANNTHGRAVSGTRLGLVMATVKDANDSEKFHEIGSNAFSIHQLSCQLMDDYFGTRN